MVVVVIPFRLPIFLLTSSPLWVFSFEPNSFRCIAWSLLIERQTSRISGGQRQVNRGDCKNHYGSFSSTPLDSILLHCISFHFIPWLLLLFPFFYGSRSSSPSPSSPSSFHIKYIHFFQVHGTTISAARAANNSISILSMFLWLVEKLKVNSLTNELTSLRLHLRLGELWA